MRDQRIYQIANEETYQDGEIIFSEGSSGNWVYVILSGAVEISRNPGGRKYIIEMLGPGEVFGELGFIGGIKRTATATASGETTLGVIDREFLEKEFNQLSGQFRSILEIIILRFRKMLNRTCDFTRRAEPRVPKILSLVFKDQQAFIKAYTANVSSGGLFIKTKTPLNPGDQFVLKLQLPGLSAPLQTSCEVIWSRPPEQEKSGRPSGMGVRFREISKRDYQILKGYLSTARGERQGKGSGPVYNLLRISTAPFRPFHPRYFSKLKKLV